MCIGSHVSTVHLLIVLAYVRFVLGTVFQLFWRVGRVDYLSFIMHSQIVWHISFEAEEGIQSIIFGLMFI